jgi:hypothetical protein
MIDGLEFGTRLKNPISDIITVCATRLADINKKYGRANETRGPDTRAGTGGADRDLVKSWGKI